MYALILAASLMGGGPALDSMNASDSIKVRQITEEMDANLIEISIPESLIPEVIKELVTMKGWTKKEARTAVRYYRTLYGN